MVSLYLLEMCVPSRDSKRLLSAVLPMSNPSGMGLEFSWARKKPQGSGLCHSLSPPDCVNLLGMGCEAGILLGKEESAGVRAMSLTEPPAQPELMFGFTPSSFYTKAAFRHKGKSSKNQGQNKRKTKRTWT